MSERDWLKAIGAEEDEDDDDGRSNDDTPRRKKKKKRDEVEVDCEPRKSCPKFLILGFSTHFYPARIPPATKLKILKPA